MNKFLVHLAVVGLVTVFSSMALLAHAEKPQTVTPTPGSADKNPNAVDEKRRATKNDAEWSPAVNNLQARLVLKRSEVLNGTPIISTYLLLRNVSDVTSFMKVPWSAAKIKFDVVSTTGNKIARGSVQYDGRARPAEDLILPFRGELPFDISMRGAGVAGNKAALIDLGPTSTWIIEPDTGNFFLKAELEVDKPKKDREGLHRVWHGRIELPPVQIPLKTESIDNETIDQLINEWGPKLIEKNSGVSDDAKRTLSLIDDVRVIPWYLKAMETNNYDLKFAALDRLGRFNTDDALAGLKKGMTTKGTDIGNCSKPAVAERLAENVRHCAAGKLAGSPHREAKRLLLTMWNDPSSAVRTTVLHTLGEMKTPESLEMLKTMSKDSDESVRNEALRYLKLRSQSDN